VVERQGGTLYCSVLFFGPDGRLEGKTSKIIPTTLRCVVWAFGDASTIPAIKTEFGTIGAAICWENYMPLFSNGHVRQKCHTLVRPLSMAARTCRRQCSTLR